VYCKYLKKRTKGIYCAYYKDYITFNDCKQCDFKEYKIKEYKPLTAKTPLKARTELKKVSKKYAKIEKNRKSIFVDNFNKCIECGKSKNIIRIDKHEIFGGSRRQISIKWGMVIPLCRTCHNTPEIVKKWQIIGQQEFVKKYDYDLFIKEFKIDYIFKHKKKTEN